MTTKDKAARRNPGLPELAKELQNVSPACRTLGYSRQQFYEIRRNFQTFGVEGLIDKLPGAKGPHPNRVAKGIEDRILKEALDHPTHGALRVAQDLALEGLAVSSGGVRGVWQRHDLVSRHDRLLRLEKEVRQTPFEFSQKQVEALERFSPEFRERHIESQYTGDLVAVATFFAGHLKGAGKVYLQSAIDCFSRYAWGRLYTALHQQNAGHRCSHPQ